MMIYADFIGQADCGVLHIDAINTATYRFNDFIHETTGQLIH